MWLIVNSKKLTAMGGGLEMMFAVGDFKVELVEPLMLEVFVLFCSTLL
jgi:hypothetical protein